MKYRLIGSNDFLLDPTKTILNNRGIEDAHSFLNVNESHTYSHRLLNNINKAVQTLIKHGKAGGKVFVQVDADL